MALGTQERRTITERGSRGALYVVHTVTIDTGRHILIAFLCQSFSVHAFPVHIINLTMALCAGLRHLQACISKKLASILIGKLLLCMRVMTIGTHRRIFIPACQLLLVHTIQCQLELLFMT